MFFELPDGEGQMAFSNGQSYKGNFKAGVYHGRGQWTSHKPSYPITTQGLVNAETLPDGRVCIDGLWTHGACQLNVTRNETDEDSHA
jgi:hypothetical protein